jgi:hypothetical protein
MNAPSVEHLLQAWERGCGLHPVRRALALLHAASPDTPLDAWACMPIGRRDSALLDLRETLFGKRIETVMPCPQCGEILESDFGVDDLRVPASELLALPPALQWHAQGYAVDYRLPTSADLLQVLTETRGDESQTRLLTSCIGAIHHKDQKLVAGELPADIASAIQQEMARHDPGAEIRVTLSCPACMHAFDAVFDIVDYLWSELDDWAQRTLAQVHTLASAYGWSEPQILALSPARRQHYIDRVQA